MCCGCRPPACPSARSQRAWASARPLSGRVCAGRVRAVSAGHCPTISVTRRWRRRLYPAPAATSKDWRSLPDWPAVHRELRRKGVTLQLVWEEYRATHPDGYGCSRFCELYRAWEGRLSPTMRQTHVAGEKMFVDYAGTTIEVIDATIGEVQPANCSSPCSGPRATPMPKPAGTQTLPDWIGSHTRAFAFFGGVAAMMVSDNLKSGITKACFYEPAVNRSLCRDGSPLRHGDRAGAAHKPRDKAKVEVGVQVATRWIIAKLRNRQFFSLLRAERGDRRRGRCAQRPSHSHLGASRALFDGTDRAALKPLPAAPYVYAEWKECQVGLDYHVEVEKHYYSVPHALLRETVWARITARTIELFHHSNRVAVHVRSSSNRNHTTVREHMPSSHRRYADWTPERIQRRANEIGPKTSALIEIILRERTHPEQGFRASIGILRHASNFGHERLEAACGRALDIGARSYTSVTSILKNNLDRQRPATATDGPAIVHSNIRGPRYFH